MVFLDNPTSTIKGTDYLTYLIATRHPYHLKDWGCCSCLPCPLSVKLLLEHQNIL
ncbi:hypothetical protein B0F90DRAFT_1683654 [Multifurca ochricompacta]|uniref:Uncharacterized protein n=1 Tax=Multifurca ochricompacta TaxID=376703 RepID=A0AAD4MD05_9AGAM|nr:hypothetical protein B0F90DRAFT_1683654 [Multifurca ochricompacta]